MGTRTDMAIETADITLLRGDPRAVGQAISLSQRYFSETPDPYTAPYLLPEIRDEPIFGGVPQLT
jgi:hypothetical protein